MASTALPPCSVLVLAGGRGARMGGRDKGLVEWQGEPLVARACRAARAHTDDLILSCNRNAERYARWADRLVGDREADFPGPLAGVRAGLAVARHPALLVLPCDAPLVDDDLVEALRRRAAEHPGVPVMVRHGTQWEPLFCLLPVALADALEAAWNVGERSLRRILLAQGAVALPLAEDDPRLANLNTPERLAETSGQAPAKKNSR